MASRRAVGTNPMTYEYRIPVESILEGLSTALKVISKAGYSTQRDHKSRKGQDDAREYKSRKGADRNSYFSQRANEAFQTLKRRGPLQNLGGALSQCGTKNHR